jgi:hypothetical protein
LGRNATAADTLFLPLSGKLPYHFVGTGGKQKLVTVGGNEVEAQKVDILALVLSPTLFDLHLRFLETKTVKSIGGLKCSNVAGEAETALAICWGILG